MLLLQLWFFKKIKGRLNAVIKSKPVSCTELSNWIPVDTELEKLLFTQMLETFLHHLWPVFMAVLLTFPILAERTVVFLIPMCLHGLYTSTCISEVTFCCWVEALGFKILVM